MRGVRHQKILAAECDVLVFPAANQLGKHTDLGALAQRLQQAGVPLVVIGVGAQAESFEHKIELSEGTKNWD